MGQDPTSSCLLGEEGLNADAQRHIHVCRHTVLTQQLLGDQTAKLTQGQRFTPYLCNPTHPQHCPAKNVAAR